MSIALSSRLQKIADYIPTGSRVIDVGTDHAYIPIWLLQTGRSDTVTAADVRPGPLSRAKSDAEKAGVSDRLQFVLTDGLCGISPDMVDCIIIAGMGGETIIGILQAAPWALDKHLILQPQSKINELRDWLGENGCAIGDASLVYDTGRIYLVWNVCRGSMRSAPAVDPVLIEKRDKLLKPYAEDQIKRLRKQLSGKESAVVPGQEEISQLRGRLDAFLNLYEEVCAWQA